MQQEEWKLDSKQAEGQTGKQEWVVREHPLVVGHADLHPSGPGKPLEGLHSKCELKCFSTPKIFLKYCIYLFLERGEGREKEEERNINWLPLTT